LSAELQDGKSKPFDCCFPQFFRQVFQQVIAVFGPVCVILFVFQKVIANQPIAKGEGSIHLSLYLSEEEFVGILNGVH